MKEGPAKGHEGSPTHKSMRDPTRRLEAMFARFTEGSREAEDHDKDSHDRINAEAHAGIDGGLSAVARVGMLSAGNSPVGRWLRGGALAAAANGAKRMRDATRLKALQRTPYPMVLARIKLLLDRLQHFKGPLASSPSTLSRSRRLDSIVSRAGPSRSASMKSSNALGLTSSRSLFSAGLAGGFESPTRTRERSAGPESDCEGGGDDDGEEGVCRLPLDKIMEELNTTYAYVSDFLRKVPEHTRIMSILWSHMENYKKDQDVYMAGDDPEKFYIILTGQVEVWTYPPGHHHHHATHSLRERSVITTLKKGQSFGDQAILNNDVRSECVTPTSNCCFLTLERHAFMDIFGSYFTEKLQQAEQFFMRNVSMFQKVAPEDGMKVIRHMLLSSFKAGREWDPYSDQQIYFIRDGCCTMDAYDRKFVVQESALRMGLGDAPAMAEAGPLAHVLIQGGRAVGTLGHEEELRRLRRQLIPKKLMTRLAVGGLFGGGPAAMGEGEMQASLKVLADTDVEMYHMHIDLFSKHASPELMKALRDDISFKLTYYFGRNGTINDNTVVGHNDALLQVTVRTEDANPALTAALNASVINPNSLRGRSIAKSRSAIAGPGTNSTSRKAKRGVIKVHEPGQFGPEVEKALRHVHELQEGYANDPVIAKHMELLKSGVTPVQRFWSTPAVAGSARGNAISGLLASVFPEGLAPLGDKIDELIERAARKTEQEVNQRPHTADGAIGLGAGARSPSGGGSPRALDAAAASPAAQRMDRLMALRSMSQFSASQSALPLPATEPSGSGRASPSRWASEPDDGPRAGSPARFAGIRTAATAASPSRDRSPSLPDLGTPGGGGLYQRRAKNSPAALTAAGIMWERAQDVSTPSMRQCLTYEEIMNVRKLQVEAAGGAGAGGKFPHSPCGLRGQSG